MCRLIFDAFSKPTSVSRKFRGVYERTSARIFSGHGNLSHYWEERSREKDFGFGIEARIQGLI